MTWGDVGLRWGDPRYTWDGSLYVLPVIPRTLTEILRDSHSPLTRLRWLSPTGVVLQTWEMGTRHTAILLDGSTSRDRGRTTRASGSLVIANPDGAYSPQGPGDPFFGGERLRIEQGAIDDTGGPQYLTTGTYIVSGWSAPMTGQLMVNCNDPLSILAQPMGDAVSVTVGTTAEDALRLLWEPVLGDSSEWQLDGDSRTVAAGSWGAEQDRLQAGVDLMAALGLEVFTDPDGIVVLQPVPDPTTQTPVRAFTSAPREAAALDLARSGSRLPYNRVVVVVESPDREAFYATADVDDPTSPIHRDRIGLQVAPVYRSESIPDLAAAVAVARSLLGWYSRYVDSVDGGFIPDPTLMEGDVVTFSEPVSGASDRYLIERRDLPVLQGTMSLTTTKILPIFAGLTP